MTQLTHNAGQARRTSDAGERLGHVLDTLDNSIARLQSDTTKINRRSVFEREIAATGAIGSDGDWRCNDALMLQPPLDAALRVFFKFGYHGATVREIAKSAEMSVPGLYHYYDSKQAMLTALLERTMEDLLKRSRLAVRDGGDDVVKAFCNLVECLVLFHTYRQDLGFLGASEMRSLEEPQRQRISDARRDVQAVMDQLVGLGVAAGRFHTTRPKEAARAVTTMCVAVAHWFRREGSMDAETIASHYIDFALGAVHYGS